MVAAEGNVQQRALLAVIQAPSTYEFLKQYKQRKAAEIHESLQTFPKKLIPQLCDAINNQVTNGITHLHHDATAEEQEAAVQAAEALQLLASLIMHFIKEKHESALDRLQVAATSLHDHALLSAAAYPQLQDTVARMCLAWWEAGAINKAVFITQTLPYLLVCAITTGKAADVKRCNAMHTALALLDYDDGSIADLERLLLRAAMSPAFLRLQEGRRFLAYLFTLEAQLVRELGAIVRNQIPCGRKSVLEAYGQILGRAWREAIGACQLEVESLIQGLMQAAIHASTEAMAGSIRRVLSELHKHKGAPGIDQLLLRLYQPILFRAMAVANPAVRLNALHLFLDAFPLQDPHGPIEEMDELLNRQFALISTALGDAVPAVRAAAAKGICCLLDEFWELIPAAVTVPYLKRLTGELAYDGSSPAERAAVLEGLAILVANPMAHSVLKLVLPKLAPLFSDRSLRVRVAMADLLLIVGTVRDLHFYDIVPVTTLLEAMGTDQRSVAERVQQLLLPSYGMGTDEGPARVLAVLQSFPEAGRLFCQFLSRTWVKDNQPGKGAPLQSVLDLCKALQEHLQATLSTDQPAATKLGKGKGRASKRKQPSSKEAASKEAGVAEGWAGIFGGMAELCAGLAAGPSGDSKAVKALFAETRLGPLMDAACLSSDGRRAAATLLGAAPANVVAAFCNRWLATVLFSPDVSEGDLKNSLASTCSGHALSHVVRTLMDALQGGITSPAGACASAVRCSAFIVEEAAMRDPLLEHEDLAPFLECLTSVIQPWSQSLADAIEHGGSRQAINMETDGDLDTASDTGIVATALLTAMKLATHIMLRSRKEEQDLPVGGDDAAMSLLKISTAKQAVEGCLGACKRMMTLLANVNILPGAPEMPTAMRECYGAVLAVVSVSADGAKVLGRAEGAEVALASCKLATELLHWLCKASGGQEGLLRECGPLADHAARLACNVLACTHRPATGVEQQDEQGLDDLPSTLGSLSSAIVDFGCSCSADNPVLLQLKPYLPDLLPLLCKHPEEHRWLVKLSEHLEERGPAAGGAERPPQNGEESAATADVATEQTSGNEIGPEPDVDLHPHHPFVQELLLAANKGQVKDALYAFARGLAAQPASADTMVNMAASRLIQALDARG